MILQRGNIERRRAYYNVDIMRKWIYGLMLQGYLNPINNIEYRPWPKKWTLSNDDRFSIRPNDDKDIYLKKLRKNIKRPGLVSRFFGGYKVLKRDNNEKMGIY